MEFEQNEQNLSKIKQHLTKTEHNLSGIEQNMSRIWGKFERKRGVAPSGHASLSNMILFNSFSVINVTYLHLILPEEFQVY